MVSSLRLCSDDGVDVFRFNLVISFCTTDKGKIGCVFWNSFIQFHIFYRGDIFLKFHEFDESCFDDSSVIPSIHTNSDKSGKKNRHPTAIKEFDDVGTEKSTFDDNIN